MQPRGGTTILRWPLVLLGVVLVVLTLQWTRAVSLPLALAVFIIALAWPVQVLLERRLPRWLAYIGTCLCVLALLALFIALLWTGIRLMGEGIAQYRESLDQSWTELLRWARRNGVTLPTTQIEEVGFAPLLSLLRVTLEETYSAVGLLGLTFVFMLLGLIEARTFAAKLRQLPAGGKLRLAAIEIGQKFRRYMLVRTFVSIVTGVLTWAYALVVGLELALTWGLIAFVLNYIPFVGSILAIAPPVLFAAVQSGDWAFPIVVFLGMATIQVTMGNYVDPRLEGRALALSPLVVVVSIFFWGLVWGVPGAFIGVPLTIGIATACSRFEATEWLALLLGNTPPRTGVQAEESPGKERAAE
ncbi:MAG TPA: AI-2E family transporter [Kiloniellales bacterium]|nr:AI-2E family transporter [Kiloniellales bacterium]